MEHLENMDNLVKHLHSIILGRGRRSIVLSGAIAVARGFRMLLAMR